MKKLLILLSLLLSLPALAETQTLVVWQKDGQKVFYSLSDEPRTTFESGKLVITTDKVRVEYSLSDVVRYTYEGCFPEGIEAPVSGTGFKQRGDDICVYGLPKGTDVKLYSTSGVLLDSQCSDGQNALNFSLAGRPAGTYIVSYGDQSLKFIKR